MIEDDVDGFFVEGETSEGWIGGNRFICHFDAPFATSFGIEGSTPKITMKESDVPAGAKIGSALSIGARQYEAKTIERDGKGIVVMSLSEKGTWKGAHLRVVGEAPTNPLMIGGHADGPEFNFGIVPKGDVFVIPEVDGIDRMIAEGVVERVVPSIAPTPTPTGGPWVEYLVLKVVDLNGYGDPIRYAELPIGSFVSFPNWAEIVPSMIDQGYLEEVPAGV